MQPINRQMRRGELAAKIIKPITRQKRRRPLGDEINPVNHQETDEGGNLAAKIKPTPPDR